MTKIRTYTTGELHEIASVFYDLEAQRAPSIYAGLRPLVKRFYNLPRSARERIVAELRRRIDTETLPGYLERKKRQFGADCVKLVEDELKTRGLL